MLILHGIYENGNIKILEKNPPNVKGEATIQIQNNEPASLSKLKNYIGILKSFKKDPLEYQRKIRDEW